MPGNVELEKSRTRWDFEPGAHRSTNMKISSWTAAVLASVGLAIGTTAFATTGSATSTVDMLLYYEGHSGLLVKLATMSDLGGCGATTWYLLPDTQAHYREVFAVLLTAKTSGASVQITIGDCYEGYGRIKNVMLIG
jgi:hypothetical protein